MRWVLGGVIVLSFVLILSLLTTLATASCMYYPTCTQYNYDVCGTCQRAPYQTACNGGCNLTAWEACEEFGSCAAGDVQTITTDCDVGYIKMQYCDDNTCEWVTTQDCYLDPAGDADGDGVPNSADDCPELYAGSGTCNGCPNEDCSGTCLALETTCPPSDERSCVVNAQANQNCAGFSCPSSGCVGDNYCTYTGAPFCKASTGQCACPAASCVYSATCDLDDDNDGVADTNDLCPNTVAGQAVDFSGCSCAQKTCNDNKECTTDTCNAAQCVYTPRATGTLCNYLGDGTPSDGLCDASGTCVQSATCTASPGCRTTQPPLTSIVTGTCASGQTCYACNSGYTWNPSTNACEPAACVHQCETAQRKCASQGTSYYTCTTNAQGCRVWTTTTTSCDTADCTSYTCTPGTTFTGGCSARSGGPAPAVG